MCVLERGRWSKSMCYSEIKCVRKYESFYALSFEYHRASSRYLCSMNVLIYARACDPASMI